MPTPVEDWIARVAPGGSFIDIGGIGEGSTNERIGAALAAGATSAVMADIEPQGAPLWQGFHARMAGQGIARERYGSLDGVDISAPGLADRIGRFDTVHCTGILYHLADPVGGLRNLVSVTGRWLILNTVICPDRVENEEGVLTLPAGGALFLPGLAARERAVLRRHYRGKFGWSLDDVAPGADAQATAATPHFTPDGPSCAPWWWLLAIPAFEALVSMNGLAIRERWTWAEHCQFLLCEVAGR